MIAADEIPVPRHVADGLYRAAIAYREKHRETGRPPLKVADATLATYLDWLDGQRKDRGAA